MEETQCLRMNFSLCFWILLTLNGRLGIRRYTGALHALQCFMLFAPNLYLTWTIIWLSEVFVVGPKMATFQVMRFQIRTIPQKHRTVSSNFIFSCQESRPDSFPSCFSPKFLLSLATWDMFPYWLWTPQMGMSSDSTLGLSTTKIKCMSTWDNENHF